MDRAIGDRAQRRRRSWCVTAALTALMGGVIGLTPGVAHASGFGTVQVIADSSSGTPENGVCLDIVVPGAKNSNDVVVATGVGTGGGVAGMITVGNIPVGSYVAKFRDCGAPVPFAAFYYGNTFNKAAATTFGVTDGGTTNLGTQLMKNSGKTGSIDGTLIDGSNPGVGAPSVSVVAYSSGDAFLAAGCTNDQGHYTLFELTSTGGGIKLFFGSGASCSNDGNFKATWYGGTSFTSASLIPLVPLGDVTANNTTLALVTRPTVSVSSVSISGDSSNPIVTVNGNGFGAKASKPNPSTRPCGEADVAGNGYDYGNQVVFWDTNDQALWQAGFPGDCIGINFTSYSDTRIVFTLGDWYRVPGNLQGRVLTPGDQFTVRIKGAPKTGILTFS